VGGGGGDAAGRRPPPFNRRRLLSMPETCSTTGSRSGERARQNSKTTPFFTPADESGRPKTAHPELDLPRILLPNRPVGNAARQTWMRLTLPVYAPRVTIQAAAVAAVPSEGGDKLVRQYHTTWSLMGLELGSADHQRGVLRGPNTNEVGVSGKVRLLKNIAGGGC